MNAATPVVVITGASAGVGRATARAFAARGAHIALLARGHDGLEATRDEVERAGGRALAISVDVADADAVEAAAARVEAELGPVDIWVNNAMASVFAPFAELTAEEFRRVTEVTYLGYVHGTMAALRRMLPRDRGTIVQVGSALAYRSIPLQSAYCGAKAATRGFTDSIRCELLHDRSRVRISMVQMPALNTTQFGWTRSRMPKKAQPVPPIFQPEVAARAILHAADHAPREMYVGWPTVKAIVFGSKVAPAVGDRVLGRMGYSAQQTSEDRDPSTPDNLFGPVQGDAGAHGPFDSRATSRSPALWARTHRVAIGLLIASMGAGITLRWLHAGNQRGL
jgi:NAD(P)-dependent dehydrogenase (short-subunit alcohol dehydrogenase family)